MHVRFALIPLAAMLTATGASAQSWFLGARQTFGHESDVFVTTGGDTEDVFSTTALRGGLDTMLGRQRVYLDGLVYRTQYKDNEQLNYNGHEARAGLDWATVGNLSGGLSAASARRLVRLSVPSTTSTAGEIRSPLQRLDSVDASVRLGTAGPLAIEGGYGHRRLSYDDTNAFVAADEYKQDVANLGALYRVSGALTLGAGVSGEQTDYENVDPRAPAGSPPDSATRRGVYATANWIPTGASTINARVNVGKTEYDVLTQRDYSGVTGAVSWDWRPTAKLRFVTTLSRDAGRDVSLERRDGTTGPTSPTSPGAPVSTPTLPVVGGPTSPATGDFFTQTTFTRTSTQLALAAAWEATAKIAVDAGVAYRRNTVSGGASSDGKSLSLGATWVPTRSLTFGCDIAQELRSGSPDPRTFACFGEFLLR